MLIVQTHDDKRESADIISCVNNFALHGPSVAFVFLEARKLNRETLNLPFMLFGSSNVGKVATAVVMIAEKRG